MIKEITPPNLLTDENIRALIEAIEPEFENIKSEIVNVLIYPRIDELSEEVLDLLAWQFHIEGYELATDITEKRNIVKKAIELHRYKGTKYAIEKACEALNITPVLKEWFEYGGQPYKFKVYTGISNHEVIDLKKLIDLINEYKNIRSYLEELSITINQKSQIYETTGISVNTDLDSFLFATSKINSTASSCFKLEV